MLVRSLPNSINVFEPLRCAHNYIAFLHTHVC